MYFYDCDSHISFGSVKIIVKHPVTGDVNTVPTYMTPISVTKDSSISYISPKTSAFGPISTPIFNTAPVPSYTAYVVGIEFDYYSNYTGYEGSNLTFAFSQDQPSTFTMYLRATVGSVKLNSSTYLPYRIQNGHLGSELDLSKPTYVWIYPNWVKPTQPTKKYKMDKIKIIFEVSQNYINNNTNSNYYFYVSFNISKINSINNPVNLSQRQVKFNKGDSTSKELGTFDINPAITTNSVVITFSLTIFDSRDTSFPYSSTFLYFDNDSPVTFSFNDVAQSTLMVTNKQYNALMSTSMTEDVTTTHTIRISVN